MSFRLLLFLCLSLAVLSGSAVEAVTDYVEAQQRIPARVAQAFTDIQRLALASIQVEDGQPKLSGIQVDPLPGSRFRVWRDGAILLSVSGITAEAQPEVRRQPLPTGDVLELAVDTGIIRQEVKQEFKEDLGDDFLQVALSVAVALLLSGVLLRPLTLLDRAVNRMAQQQIAQPVPVPPGNDALARLAVNFNRMGDSIQAALERERFFTRYASHELRTPLSVLKLQLEAEEMGLQTLENTRPALERNVDRMQRVLDAMLSLARASEQSPEPLPVNTLVSETLQLFDPERRARVQVSLLTGPQRRVAQPYLIGQCVLNLVDNALKYTTGPVKLTVREDAGTLLLQVADEGGGVPEEQLGQLTHSFYRLSKHVPGSGLGLSFVKHIARTLSGDLKLRNTRQGLEVTLHLPVTKETL